MSKHSKGSYYELQARRLLEQEGYLVEKKNYNRWASKDFYGLFDILAIGKQTKLIQVKTNATDFYKARKQIHQWLLENKIKAVTFEIWLKEPKKQWRREKVTSKNDRTRAFDNNLDMNIG